ncbi:glycine zipper family protein [Chloroflexota bacterium]
MEVQSDWYNRIIKEISPYQDTLSKKDYKKYKVDLLLRVARRIDDFSSTCGECQLFQAEITSLAQGLGNLVQLPGKEERKRYFKTINNIIKHLQKQHKLVTKGQYIGIGLAIGAGIGVALGAALDNPGIGPGIGTALGLAIGAALDNKAKKEDRVI